MKSNALLKRGLLIEYASVAWMAIDAARAMLAGILAGSLALMHLGATA